MLSGDAGGTFGHADGWEEVRQTLPLCGKRYYVCCARCGRRRLHDSHNSATRCTMSGDCTQRLAQRFTTMSAALPGQGRFLLQLGREPKHTTKDYKTSNPLRSEGNIKTWK